MKRIDLNCDMGEIEQAITDGTQEKLLQLITSVNIACGAHAGDEHTMEATILQALKHGAAIGAHPGYPDRANFGRLEMDDMPLAAIADSVYDQLTTFARIARQCGAFISHVKAHGALYNQAVKNAGICDALGDGVARWNPNVVMVCLAGSLMLDRLRAAKFPTAAEAFADRRYERDGTLRNRRFPDALITDPQAAARQALEIVQQGSVTACDGSQVKIEAQTLCIHGDTPGATDIAAAIAALLKRSGVVIHSLSR